MLGVFGGGTPLGSATLCVHSSSSSSFVSHAQQHLLFVSSAARPLALLCSAEWTPKETAALKGHGSGKKFFSLFRPFLFLLLFSLYFSFSFFFSIANKLQDPISSIFLSLVKPGYSIPIIWM
jgi:hypothetical protein